MNPNVKELRGNLDFKQNFAHLVVEEGQRLEQRLNVFRQQTLVSTGADFMEIVQVIPHDEKNYTLIVNYYKSNEE